MAVAPPSTLERLSDALKSLIAAAEAGDWDRMEALSAEFLALQQAAAMVAPPRRDAASYRQQLQETLALHERAMTLCRDRMTAIEPLVRALASSATDTP